jgi:hypothetical protein
MLELKIADKEKKQEIVVEAGHIYVNEVPSLEHKMGAEIGSQASKLFEMLGYKVQKWLFVDNYNPYFEDKPIILDEQAYVDSLKDVGFSPDKVMYEADLVDKAEDVLEHLIAENFASKHDLTGKYLLNKGNYLLYDPETNHYSCSLLDACLYLEKAKVGDGAITIIDQQYTPQQKGTLTILKKLGVDTSPIVPIYYSTPQPIIHESIAANKIFLPESKPVNGTSSAIVPKVVAILKLLNQISKVSPLETNLNFEVLANVV